MSEELKPCPFCGGTSISKDGVLEQQKFCENCGSYGPRPAFDYDDAIWNDRPLEDAKEQRIAELEEALNGILALGGNMPDEHFEKSGGPNDAIMRGGLFVSCKEIARAASKQEGADHG